MDPGDLCGRCRSMLDGRWTWVVADGFLPEYVLKNRRKGRYFCLLDEKSERFAELEASSQSNTQAINLTDIRSTDLFIHHDRALLEVAALGGCHMCTYLLDSRTCVLDSLASKISLHERWDDEFPDGEYLASPLLYSPYSSVGYVRFLLDFIMIESLEPVSIDRENCREWLMFGFDTVGRDMQVVRASSRAQLSPHVVDRIREWRQGCALHHRKCIQHSQGIEQGAEHGATARLPNRLISIECDRNDPSGPAMVRLILSDEMDPSLRYVTLSHCWGKNGSSFQLTTRTMSDLRKGIPKDSLPILFSDAVDVASTMGLRYIWIDALCIVQDSLKDWLLEYPTMAAVFSQSDLNIAATSATGSDESIFQARNSLLATPLVFESSWTGTGERPGRWSLKRSKNWFYHVDGGVLNRRGWVLQELLLAPRTLHFAADQIWWSCRTRRLGEALLNDGGSFIVPNALRAWTRTRWASLMEIFAQLGLTRGDDKLAAIAGLAAAWASRTGYRDQDYLAGIWRYDLRGHLLWAATTAPQTRNDLAPSWSWISLNGAIRWHTSVAAARYHSPKVWADIKGRLDADYKNDPYARIIKATLYVTGFIFPIGICPGDDDAVLQSDLALEASLPVHLPHATTPLEYQEASMAAGEANNVGHSPASKHPRRTNVPTGVIFLPDVLRTAEQWRKTETYFLPVRLCTCRYKSRPDLRMVLSIFGITLEPAESRIGVYIRVGFLRLFYSRGMYDTSKVENLWAQSSVLPAGRHKGQHADGRYMIEIV